jgi:hydroxymethylpyrimidine kinase/phosphomethylpyrimidine kinase/thiamine-phosphate diphosphorylase
MVGERIETANTHGSGCTTASALAACLAQGMDIEDAVVMAKAYVTQGIRLAKPIGSGAGPVSHDGWLNQLQNLPMVYKRFDLAMDAPQFELCDSDQLGLYPVVDSIEWLEQLLPLGVETIQLRVKDVPEAELDIMVAQAVALQKKYGARLFINDYWQLAIKHDAYGVHLGQEDLDDADLNAIAGAGLKLGVSTHSYYEIARAHGIAPSYVAMGPIFPTTTKQMRWEQQGIEQLMDWVDLLGDEYPLVAIGGIDYDRAQLVLQTGVGSVAMVSAITKAQDFQMETQRLLALFR